MPRRARWEIAAFMFAATRDSDSGKVNVKYGR